MEISWLKSIRKEISLESQPHESNGLFHAIRSYGISRYYKPAVTIMLAGLL